MHRVNPVASATIEHEFESIGMANTYTSLYYHMVFGTRNRQPFLGQDIEKRIWSYIGGVARRHKLTAVQVGGVEDHIHALILSPAIVSPSQIAQVLKGDTSKWIHSEFPTLREFRWQDGYGVFSVSKSKLSDVIQYIQIQREHHQKRSFQVEYLELLRAHEIEYDERYLWG